MIPIAFLIFILPRLLHFVAGQVVLSPFVCLENGNYTSNSIYKANLDTLLSNLTTNINPYGFYNASVGQPPDQANAIVLCRGDVELNVCRQCVLDAAANLANSSCPYQKQAISWYKDFTCMLRYSNETIFGAKETFPERPYCNNNGASPDYGRALKRLLDDIRTKALNGSSQRKFATGSIPGPDSRTVFALVQCSSDLSTDDCHDCLNTAYARILMHCPWKIGGRVLLPSCSLRYENYIFFNQITSEELAPPPPQALDRSPTGKNEVQALDRSPTGKNEVNRTPIIVIVIVTISVCMILAAVMGIWLTRRRKHKPSKRKLDYEATSDTSEISTAESLQFSFSTIKAATNDFSEDNKLGRGGFGVVYKGILGDGREIAVKRLSTNSSQGFLEFKNEALLLAKLLHRNLVRLMGFCQEGLEKILVYEYVLNGSLDRFIFNPVNHSYLDWDKRFKIIRGIAKGLLYLHEHSQLKIIHRDLKASNVLLDSEMAPKIADFGLAKLFKRDETHGRTKRIVGTFGYMPPEYAIKGQFSVKSDVFSFGVLVLEIISGKKNTDSESEDSATVGLLSFVWKNWREDTHANIVDPFLRADSNFMINILRCIQIGLLCVQQNPMDRPTMASVVLMLSNFSVTMTLPSQPAFVFGRNDCSFLSSVEDTYPDKSVSKNEVSITDLCAR